MSNFSDVVRFHEKFNIPFKDKPEFLDEKAMMFRIKFLQEELDELTEATESGDLATAIDSLVDLVWVAYGTADMMGVNESKWSKFWNEVVRANMDKERASSEDDTRSKRKNALDIVKPEGWKPPDMEGILKDILDE
jgi:predicted HAD superfamily Cof-like phosphohydrolase